MGSARVSIRLCRQEDVPAILEIRRRTFLHFAPDSYSPEQVETLLLDVRESEFEEMVKNRSLFVAEMDQKVIGCGGWLSQFVRHVYVLPEMTRQGVGSDLLRTLEDDYQQRTGLNAIKAGVILYARGFYESNGYEFLAEDTDWDGSKFYRMKKKLTT